MCDGDGCKTFAKVLLVIINLFFFLLGLLMLAFGIAMVVAPDKVAKSVMDAGIDLNILGDVNYAIKAAGIFMIVLGGVVTIIGAFGFFGACCENTVLLIVYLILVIIILLAEVALIIFAACFPAALKTYVQEGVNKTLIGNFSQDIRVYPNVSIGSDNKFGYSWAATQMGARCCGNTGPKDYQDQNRYTMEQRSVQFSAVDKHPINYPISCCKLKDSVKFPNIHGPDDFENFLGCITPFPSPAAPGSYNDKGCYDAIESTIGQASRIAIGIAAAIVGTQIIIIILGFILCCALQNSKSLTV